MLQSLQTNDLVGSVEAVNVLIVCVVNTQRVAAEVRKYHYPHSLEETFSNKDGNKNAKNVFKFFRKKVFFIKAIS